MKRNVSESLLKIMKKRNINIMKHGYSGRGMYGEYCFAFTADDPFEAFGEILAGINNSFCDADTYTELAEMMKNARTDSLGLSRVVYFQAYEPFATNKCAECGKSIIGGYYSDPDTEKHICDPCAYKQKPIPDTWQWIEETED